MRSSTLELIRLANLCEVLQCLPQAGGILDQDVHLVKGLELALQVKAELAKMEQEKAKNAARSP